MRSNALECFLYLKKKRPEFALSYWTIQAMAEKEGFEPSRRYTQPTPLAGEPLTAAWVLLRAVFADKKEDRGLRNLRSFSVKYGDIPF